MQTNLLYTDEGMWTFHSLPLDKIKQNYNFEPSKKLIENIQLSSIRLNDGGSGSFVSPNGLLITNHHVAMSQLQKLSSEKKDIVKNGYYAKNQKDELKCPDLEINILLSFENVSDKIFSQINEIKDSEKRIKRIKEIIAGIEKESTDSTGLKSDVIEFYEGAEFWLYRYKKYSDIRLVMTPEISLAAFGGDSDNFNFPRYSFDFTFFRVYENNKPIKTKNYLKFSKNSVTENDLVFVSGHPGSTDRQKTVSQILFDRDYTYPIYLRSLNFKLENLKKFSTQSKENLRLSKELILGIENSIKAIRGEFENLQDKNLISILQKREAELKKENNSSFEKIENAQNKLILRHKEFFFRTLGSSKLANIALKIYRYKQEILKPNEKRLEEYRDSNLDSFKLKLLSKAKIVKDLEKLNLKTSLEISKLNLENDDEYLKKAIGENNISELVETMIDETNLDNQEFRENLMKQSIEEIESSNDALIKWIIQLEPILRTERSFHENQIESIFMEEGKKISELKFKIYGKEIYPDATFSLRLSYGTVKNYTDSNSILVPFKTSFHGLFERSNSFKNKNDFYLTDSIMKVKNKLDLNTSVNFVSTNDIVGGNSGSPVINTKGEFVGIIFDGNFHSHIWTYLYSNERGRSISVDVNAIREVLKKVYKTKSLLEELN